jgi:hypothetical protein
MGVHEIKVPRQKLLTKIKENKTKHIEEFNKAVVAYKLEVSKQLKRLTKLNKSEGTESLNIELELVKPVNNSKHYDILTERYSWEIEPNIILSHNEFNEYVLDENHVSLQASMSNSYYLDTTIIQ